MNKMIGSKPLYVTIADRKEASIARLQVCFLSFRFFPFNLCFHVMNVRNYMTNSIELDINVLNNLVKLSHIQLNVSSSTILSVG